MWTMSRAACQSSLAALSARKEQPIGMQFIDQSVFVGDLFDMDVFENFA